MKLLAAQFHAFKKEDREEADEILGVFISMDEAKNRIGCDMKGRFGGIKIDNLVHSQINTDRDEFSLLDSDGFVYVITEQEI